MAGFVDPAHPELNNGLLYNRAFCPGDLVYVAAGQDVIKGVEYWQLSTGLIAGWFPAVDRTGDEQFEATNPACPGAQELISGPQRSMLAGPAGLVCFGRRELRVRGNLECNRLPADGGPGGVPWMSSAALCHVDRNLAVYGDAVTRPILGAGRPSQFSAAYEVVGHFDDAAAGTCYFVPIGVNLDTPGGPPDTAAVMFCRLAFVATSALPAN